MRRWWLRTLTALATLVILAGAALAARTGEPALEAVALLSCVPAALAWLVTVRRPDSAVAAALAWSSASVVLVMVNDLLAASDSTTAPLPGSGLAAHWWVGGWPVNLAGTLALLLVFPDATGRTPARRRIARAVPWAYLAGVSVTVGGMWDATQADGRVVAGAAEPPIPIVALGLALVASSLVLAIADLAHRYRRGDPAHRRQIRWLMVAGVVVLALLASGWVMHLSGLPLGVSYLPFIAAILVLVPAAVAVAMIRHDLFDVDWLLGAAVAWLATALVSALLFALVAVGISSLLPVAARGALLVAAFVAALVLLPVHRRIGDAVQRLVDRERYAARALAEAFTTGVRAGTRRPEDVGDVLRAACGDPTLRLLVRDLNDASWRLPDGSPTQGDPTLTGEDVRRGAQVLARVETASWTVRSRRLIIELTRTVTLPIEMCRLHAALDLAAREARAATGRLAEATAAERRRLEHDLHDGIQQRIVGTAIRLRTLQQVLPADHAAEVDRAVVELRETVDELRRLARGIRPSRLDDGLAAALVALRMSEPVPVRVGVEPLPELSEAQASTAYFVVAEAVTNALKHAQAQSVDVHASYRDGHLALVVADDGIGLADGVVPRVLADRASSIGGTVTLRADRGAGTTVRVVIPCAC